MNSWFWLGRHMPGEEQNNELQEKNENDPQQNRFRTNYDLGTSISI